MITIVKERGRAFKWHLQASLLSAKHQTCGLNMAAIKSRCVQCPLNTHQPSTLPVQPVPPALLPYLRNQIKTHAQLNRKDPDQLSRAKSRESQRCTESCRGTKSKREANTLRFGGEAHDSRVTRLQSPTLQAVTLFLASFDALPPLFVTDTH